MLSLAVVPTTCGCCYLSTISSSAVLFFHVAGTGFVSFIPSLAAEKHIAAVTVNCDVTYEHCLVRLNDVDTPLHAGLGNSPELH